MTTNEFLERMGATPAAQQMKRLAKDLRDKASPIKFPSQAQLRALSHSINARSLLDLDLITNENETLSPSEILAKFQHATAGENRDRIFELATGFEMGTGMDIEDVNIPLDATPNTDTFTLFKQLPPELRDKIWKHATEYPCRLIEIIWQYKERRWWATKTSQLPPLGVFSACRESRASTKFIRENCVIKLFGSWINIYSDLIWMNSLHDILGRRFMKFCMDLYEVSGPSGDEDEDESESVRALARLPRLAVDWQMWEEMLSRADINDDLSVGGEKGLLRENFKGLKRLVLIHVEDLSDKNGDLYKDERVLVEEELLDAYPLWHLSDPEAALKRARENLKFEPGECEVSLKVLQRGNDGLTGDRTEYDDSSFGLLAALFQIDESLI